MIGNRFNKKFEGSHKFNRNTSLPDLNHYKDMLNDYLESNKYTFGKGKEEKDFNLDDNSDSSS